MPIGYLDVPAGADRETKREMVAAMYEALHETFPFPDDHRIFVQEWADDLVSRNGELGSEPARPVLVLHVPAGVERPAKERLAGRLAAAVDAAYGRPDFAIFLQEYPLDRVAIGGHLLAADEQRVEAQHAVYGHP